MKKSIIIAFLCFFGSTQINAQVSFKPGLRVGANFAHLTQTDDPNEKFGTRTDFYIGGFGTLNLSKVYALQPEINYSRQGAEYQYIDQNNVRHSYDIKLAYLSLGLANKFKFDKFNFQVGPTFDIRVNDNKKVLGDTYNDSYNYYDDDLTGIDLAFFLGAGYNFTENFGIEARIKKGIVPFDDDFDSTNVVFQTGITYTFK
ncbi:porin family protein [Flavobacterium sp. H122]|uniref:porin family protein n=1 Tax=Flavobacterium sp. H122 TaxID=2529860 RepID=UPI0010AAC19E|nr:porin family protein [Flavobacterium sp. H122]